MTDIVTNLVDQFRASLPAEVKAPAVATEPQKAKAERPDNVADVDALTAVKLETKEHKAGGAGGLSPPRIATSDVETATETKEPTLREIIARAVAQTEKVRKGEVPGKVYLLSEIPRFIDVEKLADGAVPVVWNTRVPQRLTIEEFRDAAASSFAMLVNADMSGFIVLGRAVAAVLSRVSLRARDRYVHVSPVGIPKENVAKRINELAAHLHSYYTKKEQKMLVSRTSEYIAFGVGDERVVVHLTVCDNISQILAGYAIGSSAVAFDGQNVYLSELGRLAYTYGVNVTDLKTANDWKFVEAYFWGYSIALPDANASKILAELQAGREVVLGSIALSGDQQFVDKSQDIITPLAIVGGGCPLDDSFDAGVVAINNFTATNDDNPAGLIALKEYATGDDVAAIPVVYDIKAAVGAVRKLMSRQPININTLENVFGEHVALVLSTLITKNSASRNFTCRKILEVNASLAIKQLDFKVVAASERQEKAPSGRRERWYGAYLAGA
ncbi:MAG: hypothetical protein KGL39_26785 [Patescibacteria group bacterium]|nr:hypothetical protein [Patescibacteria group bacterium]